MKNWEIQIGFLPLSPILIGFSYQVGRCVNRDEPDEEIPFEEYSLGLLIVSISVLRFLKS